MVKIWRAGSEEENCCIVFFRTSTYHETSKYIFSGSNRNENFTKLHTTFNVFWKNDFQISKLLTKEGMWSPRKLTILFGKKEVLITFLDMTLRGLPMKNSLSVMVEILSSEKTMTV